MKLRNLLRFTVLSVLAALAACEGNEGGLTLSDVEKFRVNPQALNAFQAQNGKIGAFVLPVHAAQASVFLGVPFSDVEDTFLSGYDHRDLQPGVSVDLDDGWHELMMSDPANPNGYGPFADLTFRNTSNGRAVLVLEALGSDGGSLGISYVQMEAGDTFVYKHNVGPLIILLVSKKALAAVAAGIAVIGGVGAGASDFIEDSTAMLANCKLLNPNFGKDYCKGKCTAGTSCKIATTKSYWKWGTQAATCSCQ